MDDYCNQGKDDYSDIQDCALGVRYVRLRACERSGAVWRLAQNSQPKQTLR